MLKGSFSKKTKSIVALATMTTLLMTSVAPVLAANLQIGNFNIERATQEK